MRRHLRGAIALVLFVLGGIIANAKAHAQDYPSRPIRLLIHTPPGSLVDVLGRMLAQELGLRLGQSLVADNRAGGATMIAVEQLIRAPADGYTLMITSPEATMQPFLKKSYQYDPIRDFTPIALMNIDPAGVTVRADSNYKSLDDLLKTIKASPGKFKASGAGQGGIWHLALAGMLKDLKIDPATVPWVPANGAAQAMNDLVAGGVGDKQAILRVRRDADGHDQRRAVGAFALFDGFAVAVDDDAVPATGRETVLQPRRPTQLRHHVPDAGQGRDGDF